MEFTRKAQNLKKGLPGFGRRLKDRVRRFFAVLLCSSMVVSGFPTTFFRAFASDGSEEYCYGLEQESLCKALLTAVSEGTVLSRELDFKGEYAGQYNELFSADGTLYELKDLDIEKDRERDKVLDLRVFVRIEGDIPLDGEYSLGGEEEFIFLIINRSDEKISAAISLDNRESDVITILPASAVPSEETFVGSLEKEEEIAETAALSGSQAGSGSSGSAEVSDKSGNETCDNEPCIELVISEDIAEESITEDTKVEIIDEREDAKPDNTEEANDSPDYAEIENDKPDYAEIENDKPDYVEIENDKTDYAELENDKTDLIDEANDRSDDIGDVYDKEAASEEYDNFRNDDGTGADSDSSSVPDDRANADAADSEDSANSFHDTASLSAHKTHILTAGLEEEPEIDEVTIYDAYTSSPSDASPSDAGGIINGQVYKSVRLAGKSAGAFVTTADDLKLSQYCILNEKTAYDRIYAYMESVLERSASLETGDSEGAQELWNELMDAWEIVYEARDAKTLDLSDDEYGNLDRLTEDICQNLILAGYDPYGIMTLDNYTLEVMGSFTLNNTGWTAASSDGGEVKLITDRNTTTVWGWNPGTVTLTRRSGFTTTTHTVTVLDTFRVCVYVSALDISEAMLKILGIDPRTIDPSGYFPAGIVSVPAEYLTKEKKEAMLNGRSIYNVPLITSEDDWELLLSYLKVMDTSEDVFGSAYKGNAGNNVYKYFEDAQEYLNHASGSGYTALFYQTGGEGYSETYSDVLYHFDLLFHTNTVTYIYGNNNIHDGQGADDGSIAIGTTIYIRGVTIDEANPTFIIPDGYVFEGYYTDADCTEHWDSSKRLTSDMNIYIKLAEGVNVTVEKVDGKTEEPLENAQFLLCKIVEEETYDADGSPVVDPSGSPVTEPHLYYYDFDEYTGWIADRDQATPETTTGKLGEFEITLAGFDESDEHFNKNFCYFLWEIAAPDGYNPLNEPIFFTVTHNESDGTDRGHREVNILYPETGTVEVKQDDSGFDTLIYIKNEKSTFPVNIFKYTGNGVPLSGAEFVLSRTVTEGDEGAEPQTRTYYGIFDEIFEWDEEQEAEKNIYRLTGWITDRNGAGSLISGEDGYIHMDGISADEYVLTEIKAPDGYMLPADGVSFTLNAEGNVNGRNVIPIENTAGAKLPETGGRGALPFTLTGLLMMSGSALIYLALRRRKVRVG